MKLNKMTLPLLGLFLLLGACAPSNAPDADAISTTAAQTVEARFTEMAGSTLEAEETTPTLVAETPTVPPSTATVPAYSVPPEGCLSASLVSETVPDGTLLAPGEYFWKTWYVQNTGTCGWDSTYKLIFSSGDIMGGATVYDFPGAAAPGETVEIPVQLLAPTNNGTYRGYWSIQSPSGYIFGMANGQPMWVEIVVSDKHEYGVTSIQYEIVREPETGCPVNVWYTTYATITVSGPVTVDYEWQLSNGKPPEVKAKPLTFTQAGSQTISHVWQIHSGAVIKDRWVWIYVESPNNQEFPNNYNHIVYDCE